MNKTDLIEAVAELKDVPTKAAAKRIVDHIFDVITESLAEGESVAISGFGTLFTAERAAREGRNPQTGEPLHIPAKTAAKFRGGSSLKAAINA